MLTRNITVSLLQAFRYGDAVVRACATIRRQLNAIAAAAAVSLSLMTHCMRGHSFVPFFVGLFGTWTIVRA